MHTPDEQAWDGGDLQYEIQVENVAEVRPNRPRCTIEVVVRHADVSEPISVGPWNVHGSLGGVLQAIETYLPEFLRDMEAGIPEARSTPLSLDDFWSAVFGEDVVIARVVFDREVGR